jgi:hypothetical protein
MNAYIVAQQRTGSTLLYEFLDSHPGIFCADELFIVKGKIDYRFRMIKVYNWYRKTKGWSTDQFIDWVFSLSEHSCIKILYHQIEWFKLHNRILNTPVIHLTRRNYFHRAVSQFATVGSINTKKPDNYLVDMQDAIRRDEMWEQAFKQNHRKKYLRLYYEDLVGRNEVVRRATYTFIDENIGKTICDFFGVPYFEMFTATPKALRNKNYWDYVPEKHKKHLRLMLENKFSEEAWK